MYQKFFSQSVFHCTSNRALYLGLSVSFLFMTCTNRPPSTLASSPISFLHTTLNAFLANNPHNSLAFASSNSGSSFYLLPGGMVSVTITPSIPPVLKIFKPLHKSCHLAIRYVGWIGKNLHAAKFFFLFSIRHPDFFPIFLLILKGPSHRF